MAPDGAIGSSHPSLTRQAQGWRKVILGFCGWGEQAFVLLDLHDAFAALAIAPAGPRDEIDRLDQMYKPRDVINDYVPNPLPRYL